MSGFKDFRFPILILCLLLLDVTLVVWSCAGRSDMDISAPIVPPDNIGSIDSGDGNIPILLTTVDDGKVVSGLGVLGMYQIHLDGESETGDVAQIRRGAALGDSFDVDITGFLQGSPCQDCFQLIGVQYTEDEKLVSTFRIEHPFGLPENNPPMPYERFDLHVFDLAGIIFMSDQQENITSFPDMAAHVSIGQATPLSSDNSGFWAFDEWDGFTGDFDSQIDKFYPTQSSIHPYKILSLDTSRGNVNGLSANGFNDIRNPSGHNVFAQGSSFETTIGFNVAQGESVEFLIALTAAYGQSADGRGNLAGQRGNPRYFVPEFNRKDAWRLEIEIPEETDLLANGDLDSSTLLIAKVWDWQQNYGYPMEDIDPRTSRLDALRHSSRVASVVVDLPGVNDLDVAAMPYEGDGFDNTPLVYRIAIHNDKAALEGNYNGLVGVVDDMHGTTIKDYGIERDGITSFDVADFVTYAPFQASVIDRGADNFGVNQSMSGFGDDYGYNALSPDASDNNSMASYYYNVYIVYSAFDCEIGGGWDTFFVKSANLGVNWNQPKLLNQMTSGHQRNPTIQVNQLNGDIYVAYVDSSGMLPGAIGTDVVMVKSTDAGDTFSNPVIINSDRGGNQNQIAFCVNGSGNVYAAWSSLPDPYDLPVVAWTTSEDGLSFDNQTVINYGSDSQCDSPVVMIDQGSQSPNAGQVYLVYRQKNNQMPDIICSRYSSVSGFDTPTMVSNEAFGYAREPSAATNKNGVLFVSYLDINYETPNAVKVARSANIGYSWGHSQSLNSSINGDDPGSPVLIVKPNNNFLYLIWDDVVDGDRNIYVIRSTNGLTYIQPVKLNNDSSLQPQDMPSAAVNQFGNFFVSWRDMRYLPSGQMYFARGRT